MAPGIRNNNPGNLKKTEIPWVGKIEKGSDPVFEQFKTVEYGIRAMYKDIMGDIDNKGTDTIETLIKAYAPASENNTAGYVSTLSTLTGIPKTARLDTSNDAQMLNLGKGIIKVENGSDARYISDESIETGLKMAKTGSASPAVASTTDFLKKNWPFIAIGLRLIS